MLPTILHIKLTEIQQALQALQVRADEVLPRSTSFGLYDVFEPTYLRDALQRKELNLGHLIFGDDVWRQLGYHTPKPLDPLSQALLDSGTYSVVLSTTTMC